MKLLIVLLAVLAGVWLWQRGRRVGDAPTRPGRAKALPMVRCARCGTHLPATEAVAGHAGSYCCASHRRASEGA
jgi:uncharacterized protein